MSTPQTARSWSPYRLWAQLPRIETSHLPDIIMFGVGLAIFSDDPDWAAEQFKPRRPWVSRGHSAAVDMMAMSLCRSIVIANSSFSWWAAWLNADPEKTVIAPEFHLGFRVGRWIPNGIAVSGWQYLRVAS